MEEIDQDSTIPPINKRPRLDDDDQIIDKGVIVDNQPNLLHDVPEINTVENNNELDTSFSIFDTAFSSSQLPDDIDTLPIIENNIQDNTLQQITENNNENAEETVQEAPAAAEISQFNPDDDDGDLPSEANDILSWTRVTIDGDEITDKS